MLILNTDCQMNLKNICNVFSHTIGMYLAMDLFDFYVIVVRCVSTKWIRKFIYALGRKESTVKTLATEYKPQITLLTQPCLKGLFCNIKLSFVGLNYIIMGQVEEDGRGKIFPNSFVMSFKTKNQKILNALKNKTCYN